MLRVFRISNIDSWYILSVILNRFGLCLTVEDLFQDQGILCRLQICKSWMLKQVQHDKKEMLKFLIVIVFLCFSVVVKPAYASDFAVNRDVTYTVNEDLIVSVKEEVMIENLTTEKFPQNYTINLSSIKIDNIFAQDAQGKSLRWGKTEKKDEKTDITSLTIDLLANQAISSPNMDPRLRGDDREGGNDGGGRRYNNLPLGKGAQTIFYIYYDLQDAVVDKGQIREVILPKFIHNDLELNTQVHLMVRNSLGKLAYIVPQPITQEQVADWQKFQLSVSLLQQAGLRAVFGDFQLYDFQLTYYLSAKENKPTTATITWPPDTSWQRIAIDQVSEPPQQVVLDPDDNWLATYALTPHQEKNITIKGTAMIFAQPWKTSQLISREQWLVPQKYWETQHSVIQQIIASQTTPEQIYRYVTTNLKYDYQRLADVAARQGAVQALNQPANANCMEFTDLFVTISRAAGIPARQSLGYAYSDSPELKPLSLVADVLHAWPEYWSSERQTWIPVDPTWGVTTGGIDYFNQWDHNHLTLAINGLNSTSPLPAGFYKQTDNPQRDVVVKLGNQFPNQNPEIKTQLELKYPIWIFSWWTGDLKVYNSGPTAVDQGQLYISPSNTLPMAALTEATTPIIPPYGHVDYQFKFKPELFNFRPSVLDFNFNQQPIKVQLPIKIFIWQLIVSITLITGLAGMLYLTFKIKRLTAKSRIKKFL